MHQEQPGGPSGTVRGSVHPGENRPLTGNSRQTGILRALIGQVGPSEASVLILGESGTGKEVVARSIHAASGRCDGPFVPVNCGAIPAELLESELFGHERGAFTGAISARKGRFELADGGTLFLDEIGDMPPAMQVKLLRVLQERTFERVGSNRQQQSDVRIIAATHRDLEREVERGAFRMDLYYRLNVFPIRVPPLRERSDDIPALVALFVRRLAARQGLGLRLQADALACLRAYPWPGNVRELQNLVERLAILFPDRPVAAADLPQKFRVHAPTEPFCQRCGAAGGGDAGPCPECADPAMGDGLPADGLDLREYLADLERSLVQQALERSGWVVAHAARLLNIQRTTLVEKMRKHAIMRPGQVSEF